MIMQDQHEQTQNAHVVLLSAVVMEAIQTSPQGPA